MEASMEVIKQALQEAVERIEEVEKRLTLLEDGARNTMEAIMPKLDALLAARNREANADTDVASAASAASAAPGPVAAACAPATLLEAAQRGEAQTLLQLLATGADPLQRDARGHSALHIAAAGGHLAATAALLAHGAAVNSIAGRRRSPLHCAAHRGHLDVASLLLVAGAEKDAEDADGHTPLALAILAGHERAVALLLERRASINSVTEYPPLKLYNIGVSVPSDFFAKREQVVKTDLLAFAAQAQQWEMVKFLLRRGERVHEGTRALAWAARAARVDVVRDLLRRGAAPCDAWAYWGLEKATSSAAVVWAFVDVMPSLAEGQAGRYGLLVAAVLGMRESLEALLEAGVAVHVRDEKGASALHFAAANGRLACVNVLIEHGAEVDSVNEYGNTPLHRASSYGEVECVKALLAAGANTTKANKENKTPIDVAKSDNVRHVITESRTGN